MPQFPPRQNEENNTYIIGVTVSLVYLVSSELTDVNNLVLNVAHSNHLINTSFLILVLLLRIISGQNEKRFAQRRELSTLQRSIKQSPARRAPLRDQRSYVAELHKQTATAALSPPTALRGLL